MPQSEMSGCAIVATYVSIIDPILDSPYELMVNVRKLFVGTIEYLRLQPAVKDPKGTEPRGPERRCAMI